MAATTSRCFTLSGAIGCFPQERGHSDQRTSAPGLTPPSPGDEQDDAAGDQHRADGGMNLLAGRRLHAERDVPCADAAPLVVRDRNEQRGHAEDEKNDADDEENAHDQSFSMPWKT